nr:glucosaminidase domain-containing protein [Treponemataceae bacterium]
MKKLSIFLLAVSAFFILISYSCQTLGPQEKKECSIYIDDEGIKNEKALVDFFMTNNPSADREKVSRLACYYIMECDYEGINSDIAFVQMCLETGFLTFGNLVTVEMNNFCGLGAIDENNRGLSFASEQIGVKAHVQHL